MSRHHTPNTPFIPPLNSPESSPQPAPVIPGSPNWGPPTGGGYPVYPVHNSPYPGYSPFIPRISPIGTPGVIPGVVPSPSVGSAPILAHGGVSQDYTGYPGGNPYQSPIPAQPPQMQTPYNPGYGTLSPGQYPQTPWSAPAQYSTFQGTPWPPPAAALASPWGAPQHPHGAGAFTPYPPAGNLPGAPSGWGPPPPQQPPPQPYFDNSGWGAPPPGGGAGFSGGGGGFPGGGGGFQGGGGGYPGGGGGFPGGHFGPRAPEPPSQIYDRMGPFSEGDSYGPILDPLQVHLLDVQLQLNPLIRPLLDDSPSNQVYLNWNMLYPTSTVQRSTDPSHVSWANGRKAPATFPRLSMLRIVSEGLPWVLEVFPAAANKGVTCGDVIEKIGYELTKFSSRADFESMPPRDRAAVTAAYKHNRSRSPNVPGGSLGEGMKRLDFLRAHTIFAGIEINDHVTHRVCGTLLPATFALRCSASYPMTKQEIKDREARMRTASNAGSRARSRANSTNTRISVHPPSSTGSDDDADNDR